MGSKQIRVVEEKHTFRLKTSTNLNQNRFLPGAETTNSFLYHLGVELARQDIAPMALLVLPFQYILIASTTHKNTDVSKFAQNFHGILARDLNQQHGQSGQLWKRQVLGYEALLTVIDLLEELANLITQAVREGVVAHPDDWDGILAFAQEGEIRTLSATQPTYCGEDSPKPREVEFTLELSPLITEELMTQEEFERELEFLVRRKLAELRPEPEIVEESVDETENVEDEHIVPIELTSAQPLEFVSPQVLFEAENASPLSFTIRTGVTILPSDVAYREYVEISPRHVRYRERGRAFRRAYRQAFRDWQEAEDKNSVNFPIGTYKMRVIHRVPATAPF